MHFGKLLSRYQRRLMSVDNCSESRLLPWTFLGKCLVMMLESNRARIWEVVKARTRVLCGVLGNVRSCVVRERYLIIKVLIAPPWRSTYFLAASSARIWHTVQYIATCEKDAAGMSRGLVVYIPWVFKTRWALLSVLGRWYSKKLGHSVL